MGTKHIERVIKWIGDELAEHYAYCHSNFLHHICLLFPFSRTNYLRHQQTIR